MGSNTAFSTVLENLKQINVAENIVNIVLATVIALCLGILVAVFYYIANRGTRFSFDFSLAIITISSVIALVISVIGTNLASAFSLAGLMSIVRFRSLQQKPSDIAFIFMSMAAGVACGVGLVVPALIFVLIVGIVVDLFSFTSVFFRKDRKLVKICVPESASYEKQFDDIFKKYTGAFELHRVRLMSAGTIMEITYLVTMAKAAKTEDMVAEIRERNANFNVTVTYAEDLGTDKY